MENQLIQLYLLVCQVYDTRSETCFQRLSNNSKPRFTDQELATIYLFGHLQGVFEKKAIHKLIDNYWRHFFPHLPAYQTFVARLNLLEQTFQSVGGYLHELLAQERRPEIDHLVDSVPVMLAAGCHAYTARVAATWLMSDTVPASALISTACDFMPSPNVVAGGCHCPHTSGCAKVPCMI
jgi:hypothetical protein